MKVLVYKFHKYLGTDELTSVAKNCSKEIKAYDTTIKKLEEINMKIGRSAEKLREGIAEHREKKHETTQDLIKIDAELRSLRLQRDRILKSMPNVSADYRQRYVAVQKQLGRSNQLKIGRETATKEIQEARDEIETKSQERDKLSDQIHETQSQIRPCPEIEDDGSPITVELSYSELETEISRLLEIIPPGDTRRTTFNEQTLKEKVKDPPGYDNLDELQSLLVPTNKSIQEIPNELQKFVKDLPNLEKHTAKLATLKEKLKPIDPAKLKVFRSQKIQIQSKYKTIDFDPECSHCCQNKIAIRTITGESVIQDQIEQLEAEITANNKTTKLINKYEVRINSLKQVSDIQSENDKIR